MNFPKALSLFIIARDDTQVFFVSQNINGLISNKNKEIMLTKD
jgi:hypothetical protein